jgi:hypothetical protein
MPKAFASVSLEIELAVGSGKLVHQRVLVEIANPTSHFRVLPSRFIRGFGPMYFVEPPMDVLAEQVKLVENRRAALLVHHTWHSRRPARGHSLPIRDGRFQGLGVWSVPYTAKA